MNSPRAIPQVIALTDRWLVLSKPAGWLTIPGRSSPIRSPGGAPSELLSGSSEGQIVSEWAKSLYSPLWVVHRLDLETSGVLLFARTAKDHEQANSWFSKRLVHKTYHCLASGVASMPILKITTPIGGLPSVTQVEIREFYREGFFAHVLPRTGRRHQIRIHLSEKGYPIWGDLRYGGFSEIQWGGDIQVGETQVAHQKTQISRVALHAAKLELPSGEVFVSEHPPDFASWLEKLRKEGTRA